MEDAVAVGEAPKQDVRATGQALVAFIQGILLLAKSQNDPQVIHRLGRGFIRSLAGGPTALTRARSSRLSASAGAASHLRSTR